MLLLICNYKTKNLNTLAYFLHTLQEVQNMVLSLTRKIKTLRERMDLGPDEEMQHPIGKRWMKQRDNIHSNYEANPDGTVGDLEVQVRHSVYGLAAAVGLAAGAYFLGHLAQDKLAIHDIMYRPDQLKEGADYLFLKWGSAASAVSSVVAGIKSAVDYTKGMSGLKEIALMKAN